MFFWHPNANIGYKNVYFLNSKYFKFIVKVSSFWSYIVFYKPSFGLLTMAVYYPLFPY